MGLLGQLASGWLGGNTNNSGGAGNLAGELFSMIQNQPGGLAGLVQTFQSKGLGEVMNSWVSTGQNLPISPDQVHQTLGPDVIQQMAAKFGISPEIASSGLAQMLPTVIDKLTPNGQVPEHGSLMTTGLSIIQGLMK